MSDSVSRREFLSRASVTIAGLSLIDPIGQKPEPFKISLAQWSLHTALQSKQLDHLDFAKVARAEFDLGAIEWGFY